MNRRIWPGVIAGLLAAAVLLTVGFGAYRAGQDDDRLAEVIAVDGERGDVREGTEVVRVVGDRDHGPRFGFFLFPLLVVLLLAALFWGRGRRWHGPPHWYGYGHGPGHRPGWFDDWHHRAHEGEGSEPPGPPGAPGPQGPSTPPGDAPSGMGTTPPSGGTA